MKSHPLVVLLLVLLGSLPGCSRPAPSLPSQPQRTEPWDPALVEYVATTPLQDGGRVKPLATLASFALYRVHGRRDLQYTIAVEGKEQKVTLEPTEWFLDMLCFPDQAADYPLFRIENSGVLDALGFANEGQSQRFDFLSYRQLIGVVETLESLAQKYRNIKASDRDLVQSHLVNLYEQLSVYHQLQQQFAVLHSDIKIEGDDFRNALSLKGTENIRLATLLQRFKGLAGFLQGIGRNSTDPRLGNAMSVVEMLSDVATHDRGPRFFPQPHKTAADDEWNGLAQVIDGTLRGRETGAQVAMLAALQDAIVGTDMASRDRALRRWHDTVVAGASQRGEFGKIELETYYYRASWQYQSIHWFLLGFVLAACCWLAPRSRLLWWGALACTAVALGMLGYDVVLRCIITGRPPIKNLYDTFPFIAVVGVFTLLVSEFVLPRRIALALAPMMGALLVMFARMFEVTKGEDTMDPLVAVLDSNFWLATHVTMINTGYAAGVVAAVLANSWILARVLRIAHPADSLAKSILRMTYGAVCFSLLFSVVGTILGGVWANDSWGRFWGWDPKENGALMICLSLIALLHARMSGMVRDFGFCIWATVTGMVVLFSWFHVNLLSVGLHNYGFSSGLRDAVWTGYAVETTILVLGFVDYVLRPNLAAQTAGERGAEGAVHGAIAAKKDAGVAWSSPE